MQKFNLEDFQNKLKSDNNFSERLSTTSDLIDLDGGTMRIKNENVNKYLEKYACKDADDLIDTLWFSYGIFVTVV